MDPSDCSGAAHPVRTIITCSGPHGHDGPPLDDALENFARDSFRPCQADPVYGILSRALLTDTALVMGFAPRSADDFLKGLEAVATSPHLVRGIDLLEGPLRIVWPHARATNELCGGLPPALARVVRDNSEPGLAMAVCEVLCKAGLTDFKLINGLAAGSAELFILDLQQVATATDLAFNIDNFTPLYGMFGPTPVPGVTFSIAAPRQSLVIPCVLVLEHLIFHAR